MIVSLADEIIVNSDQFKKQMEKMLNIKVNRIYNPLNKVEILKKSSKILKIHFIKKRFKNNKYWSLNRSKRSNHNFKSNK